MRSELSIWDNPDNGGGGKSCYMKIVFIQTYIAGVPYPCKQPVLLTECFHLGKKYLLFTKKLFQEFLFDVLSFWKYSCEDLYAKN